MQVGPLGYGLDALWTELGNQHERSSRASLQKPATCQIWQETSSVSRVLAAFEEHRHGVVSGLLASGTWRLCMQSPVQLDKLRRQSGVASRRCRVLAYAGFANILHIQTCNLCDSDI